MHDPLSRADARATFLGAPVRAVLFDLDGTLVDTVADIARSLQQAFADHALAPPAQSDVRTMIGRGAPMLVERALAAAGVPADAPRRQSILDTFFGHYGRLQQRGDGSATLYPGALEGIRALKAQGIALAVVTNKQHAFAQALLARLQVLPLLDLVVGGDTCERRKPDPQPLQHAAARLHVPLAAAVMVGDSVNDLTAARAAPMRAVGVPYGYNEGRDPRELACDAMVDSIAELPALFAIAPGERSAAVPYAGAGR